MPTKARSVDGWIEHGDRDVESLEIATRKYPVSSPRTRFRLSGPVGAETYNRTRSSTSLSFKIPARTGSVPSAD